MAQQSYSNHSKFDPLFHFVIMPLNLTVVIWAAIALYHHRDQLHVLLLLMTLSLLLGGVKTRLFALKNQDRLIRLEEQVRLHRLMPNEPDVVNSLTVDQLVGLRFACDEEAPEIARRAVDKTLDRKQIKQAVVRWRADHHRV